MLYNDKNNRMLLSKKGILSMTPYRNLVTYIDALILAKGIFNNEEYSLSIDKLDEHELGNITCLFLEYDDRDTSDCFYEADQKSIDDNITCSLIKILQNNSPENNLTLSSLIRFNTIKKYKSKMQELIDERCEEVSRWSKYA